MIVIADDDEYDRRLARESLACCGHYALEFVRDGIELMYFLRRTGAFADAPTLPTSCLLFLDINMPRMNGLEALREIKADAQLRSIPVIMWTTSDSQDDLCASYRNGASLFVTKPDTFRESQELMCSLVQRWLPRP